MTCGGAHTDQSASSQCLGSPALQVGQHQQYCVQIVCTSCMQPGMGMGRAAIECWPWLRRQLACMAHLDCKWCETLRMICVEVKCCKESHAPWLGNSKHGCVCTCRSPTMTPTRRRMTCVRRYVSTYTAVDEGRHLGQLTRRHTTGSCQQGSGVLQDQMPASPSALF